MAPRLRIVTGKGGVGKSTVAASIALGAARLGKRVLLAETDSGGHAARLLGVVPTGPQMREVFENLYLVDMNAQEAIHEYALLVLRFETIYRAVFGNRLVRHFVSLVPSLGELTMLGKLWYHREQREDDRPRFDLIVLDAPATGHALTMLRAPGSVEKTVPPGSFRDNCRLLVDMLQDPAETELHIVTTPEEMPVNEAIELEQAAREELHMRLGRCFINQRVEALPSPVLPKLEPLRAHPVGARVLDALDMREGKIAAGEAHLQRLPSDLLQECLSLPRIVDATFGLEQIRVLAEHLSPWLTREVA